MKKKTGIICFAVALPLLLAGCGKTVEQKMTESMIEAGTGGKVSVNSNSNNVEVTTDQGTLKTGDNLSVPSDFPSDVYVIDGKLISVLNIAKNEGYSLTINITKSINEADEAYKTELTKNGWKINSSMLTEAMAALGATKDNRNLSVLITHSDDGNGTTVVVAETKNQ